MHREESSSKGNTAIAASNPTRAINIGLQTDPENPYAMIFTKSARERLKRQLYK